MAPSPADKAQLFSRLPDPWPEPLLSAIRARIEASARRLVVLDDDPTGAQTSQGVPVLTAWDIDLLAAELETSPAFFVLTNSRALSREAAIARLREVGSNLRIASQRAGRDYDAVFRGDSTLRGHFPHEMDALLEGPAPAQNSQSMPYVLVPYFAEGGRFTIGDVHYVQQGSDLVPAGETEFARDRSFGYSSSALPGWVEEKTGGRIRAAQVLSISIDDLRTGGPKAVTRKLLASPDAPAVVANVAADRDLEVLALAFMDAEAAGRRYAYRTAASFVRVRAGIAAKPLLTADETRSDGTTGGLLIVGSYIEKSSEQLANALKLPDITGIELSVDAVLDPGGQEGEANRATAEIALNLTAGRDVVLYTSRGVRSGASPEQSQDIGQRVASALCKVIRSLPRPRFLIVKGGSTSSEIATAGLGVRRAMAVGQLLPGVPVWQLGDESRFPGLRYVIFPGNVGEPDAVAEAVRLMRRP